MLRDGTETTQTGEDTQMPGNDSETQMCAHAMTDPPVERKRNDQSHSYDLKLNRNTGA